MVWRGVLAGKVTLGEVKRGDVDLGDLLRLNAMLDFQAAAEEAMRPKIEG